MPDLPQEQPPKRTTRWVAENLAARLLAQPWTLVSIANAIEGMLPGANPRTRAALAVRVFALGEDSYPPAPRRVVACLLGSDIFNPKPDD